MKKLAKLILTTVFLFSAASFALQEYEVVNERHPEPWSLKLANERHPEPWSVKPKA